MTNTQSSHNSQCLKNLVIRIYGLIGYLDLVIGHSAMTI